MDDPDFVKWRQGRGDADVAALKWAFLYGLAWPQRKKYLTTCRKGPRTPIIVHEEGSTPITRIPLSGMVCGSLRGPNYQVGREQYLDNNILAEVCETNEDCPNVAFDDFSGIELPFDLVAEARREEMAHMLGHTFSVVKKQECLERTGKAPMSTRWIDSDKSHGQGIMKVRSRFVARDFKKRGERDREDLFCATLLSNCCVCSYLCL